ncbi:hypothetical protein P7K49_035757, partial [Saguinus oedipus]
MRACGPLIRGLRATSLTPTAGTGRPLVRNWVLRVSPSFCPNFRDFQLLPQSLPTAAQISQQQPRPLGAWSDEQDTKAQPRSPQLGMVNDHPSPELMVEAEE